MDATSNDSRKFFSLGINWGVLIDIVLQIGLLGTWIGCLARLHWFPALFDHFRWQGAVICFVALVILSFRRKWKLVAFTVVSLLVNIWPLWQTSGTLPADVKFDGQPSLHIISYNVLTSNTRYAETLSYLQSGDADVILLLEVNNAWIKALAPLRQSHPHGNDAAQEDNFGIALFSRLPLRDFRVTPFVDDGMPSVTAFVTAGNREIRLVGTHPLPPSNAETARLQRAQLEAIAKVVSSTPDIPAIVMGDFNATPWSNAMQILRTQSTLDFRTPKPVWRPTWQVGSIFAIAIDHALCTQQLFFSKRELGPDLGSDHRAQELELNWTGR